jgi:F-box protein 11
MTFRFLRRFLVAANAGTRPKPAFRPALESMEDRLVPAVLQVGAGETYHTIGAALQAAQPGDTVRVHPGAYREAIQITENDITLEGVNQAAVLLAPSNLASNDFALLWVNGATGVTIKDLTVDGLYDGGFTQVNDKLLGLHAGIFVGNGGSARIVQNHITDVRDNPPNTTADDGFAVLVGSSSDVLNTTGTAVIAGNTIDNYGRVGVDVANAGSSATIRNNTITGLSLTLANQYVSQIGILTEQGGTATVTGNKVSQNVQTIANAFAFGMELLGPGAGITVSRNVVSDNNLGIVVALAQGAVVTGNRVFGNTADGIDLVSTSGVTLAGNTADHNGGNGIALFDSAGSLVVGNRARHNAGDGIFVDAGSTGNTFLRNALLANGVFDAEDDSAGTGTAGTGNAWLHNRGSADNKGGGLLR